MALLIRNQAAFVEQIARNDQERLALQSQGDERQLKSDARELKNDERWSKIDERQHKSEEQLMRIEKRFIGFEERLKRVETILLQLLKKEIGSQPQK